MRVLFVSATLPPEGMATAGIIGNIMLEMRNRGVNVAGLTFKNNMLDSRVSDWNDICIFHANYVREYGFKCQSICDYLFKIKRKAVDLLHETAQHPYREMAVDAMLDMLRQMNADEEYDYIISVAAFYDSTEAVVRYKKEVNGRAKYVFYQLDPFQENAAYEDIDSDWKEIYEKELYSQMDCVFTTKEIFEIKRKKQWKLKRVFAIDYPCVDMRLAICKSSLKKQEQEIRCVYAGQLNEQIRDATVVLKILSNIKASNISFYFIGSGQEELLREYSKGVLNGRLHILGSMPAKECEQWVLSADVLLIIGNKVASQVPSKVFSYMSYGIPIVATCKLQECPARKYLQEIPNALVIDEADDNIYELAGKVEQYILEYKGRRLSPKQISDYANNYTSESVTKYMLTILNQL